MFIKLLAAAVFIFLILFSFSILSAEKKSNTTIYTENKIIFFTAKWCPSCQQLKTVVGKPTAKQILKKYGVRIFTIDIDDEKYDNYVKGFQIKAIPVLKFMQTTEDNKKSKVLYTQTGYVDLETFVQTIRQVYAQK